MWARQSESRVQWGCAVKFPKVLLTIIEDHLILSISAVMTFWVWTGWLVFFKERISEHGVFTHRQPLAAGLGERWWASREPWMPGPLWLPLGEMENKQGHVEDLRFLFFFFLRFSEFVTILFLFYVLVFWLGDMWDLSFSTRDQACTRWFGRQSLNPWAAKGVYFL